MDIEHEKAAAWKKYQDTFTDSAAMEFDAYLEGWLARAESAKAVPAEGRRVEEPVAWLEKSGRYARVDKPPPCVADEFIPLFASPAIAEGFVAVKRDSVNAAADGLEYWASGGKCENPGAEMALVHSLRASADSGREKP